MGSPSANTDHYCLKTSGTFLHTVLVDCWREIYIKQAPAIFLFICVCMSACDKFCMANNVVKLVFRRCVLIFNRVHILCVWMTLRHQQLTIQIQISIICMHKSFLYHKGYYEWNLFTLSSKYCHLGVLAYSILDDFCILFSNKGWFVLWCLSTS